MVSYATVAPLHIAGTLCSFVGMALVLRTVCMERALGQATHAAKLLAILTVFDFLYAFKFLLSAVTYYCGWDHERDSFHLIPDDCLTASAYEHFMGLVIVSLNMCWVYDFVCILRNPLRNTRHFQKYYAVFVICVSVTCTVLFTIYGPLERASEHTCWIRDDVDSALMFEIPLYLFVVFALGSLVYACTRLKHGSTDTEAHRAALRQRHAYYVVAFVVLWAFPMVHQLGDPEDRSVVVTVLVALATTMQAAVLACIRLIGRAHLLPAGCRCSPRYSGLHKLPTSSSSTDTPSTEATTVANPVYPWSAPRGYGTEPTAAVVVPAAGPGNQEKQVPLLCVDVTRQPGRSPPGPRGHYAPPPPPTDLSESLRLDLGVDMLTCLLVALRNSEDARASWDMPVSTPAASSGSTHGAVTDYHSAPPTPSALSSSSSAATLWTAPGMATPVDLGFAASRGSAHRHDLAYLLKSADARTWSFQGAGAATTPRSSASLAGVRPTSPIGGSVTSFSDPKFAELRRMVGVSHDEVARVLNPSQLRSGELKAHFSSAGSASFFCRSTDGALIVKTIPDMEVGSLVQLVPEYVDHLRREPHSFLCRLYGCFSMKAVGRGTSRVNFLLMGNVQPLAKLPATALTFDLKGSTLGRGVKGAKGGGRGSSAPPSRESSRALSPVASASSTASSVVSGPRSPTRATSPSANQLLQDLAFRQLYPFGLLLPEAVQQRVLVQLRKDVTLLASHGLMDYSLLVSVVPVSRREASPEDIVPFPADPYFPLSLGAPPRLSRPTADALLHAVSKTFGRGSAGSGDSGAASGRVLRWSPLCVLECAIGGAKDTVHSPAAAASGAGAGAGASDGASGGSGDGAGASVFDGVGAAAGAAAADDDVACAGDGVVVQFGVLDFLQPYNLSKRMERGLKAVKHRQLNPDVSSVEPSTYALRFMEFMDGVFSSTQEP